MNSEELEQSLRTEFESYLKNVLADVRQEISQFQEKIEVEFVKHKSQIDEVFQEFSARVAEEKGFDEGFRETVVEHLRLAKDEGARITATAIAEAEAIAEKDSADAAALAASAVPAPGISHLRDAINDISNQSTQSSILKTLVQHAADFTPRGAFFIVKNEHLVGWRVFGKEGKTDDQTAREVYFPIASETVLGESVRSLSAVESAFGTYEGDSVFLQKFEFGEPDRMYAIPLVVRGRSVAVLYADYGEEGGDVNIEAIETLVKVASLTVELLASSPRAAKMPSAEPEKSYYTEKTDSVESQEISQDQPETESATTDASEQAKIYENPEYNFSSYDDAAAKYDDAAVDDASEPDTESFETVSDMPSASNFEETKTDFYSDYSSEEYSKPEEANVAPQSEDQTTDVSSSWNMPPAETEEAQDFSQYYEPVAETAETENNFSAPAANEHEFESTQYEETPQTFDSSSFNNIESNDAAVRDDQFDSNENYSFDQNASASFDTTNGKSESYVSEPEPVQSEEPVAVAPAQPARTRFSDRNVDLPIEVGEEERRLHNDARRFARLLVSEIKLYNEQKVKEGREAADLYERLREAIDRSREMYDKRVQPPVAARFDYFHYEVVNTLAEGDENKLGTAYPGTAV